MAPMFGFYDGQFLATWKNSPTDEDQPGQRIMYAQSTDGVNWTATDDGQNILFPSMNTTTMPTALFAEPPLYINGHMYAAASPKQFCLYPDQYQDILLLRRVFTGGFHSFGPIFWANDTVPAGYENITAALNILTLGQTDATTQADIATLANTAQLPCDASSGSLKCEACVGGCQQWGSFSANVSNERTHYTLPDGSGDVLLYRSTRGILNLQASVRTGGAGGQWVGPTLTNVPDDNANLNAGVLPDGRRYLLSNAMPNIFRDPLYLSTTVDGWNWNHTSALTSCTLPIYSSPTQPFGCLYRYQGGAKQSGCQYPQGMSLTTPGLEGFWAIFSLGKEDIWVLHAPFASL